MRDHKNNIVFLLIVALFLDATIEIRDGYASIGILLSVIAILLISRIKVGKSYVIFVIVVAVLLYVLDRMTK
jgi:hypothetical protein